MQDRGIEIVYGRWLIEGAPRVLLINTGTGYRWLDEWKGDLWNTSGIPSPAADHETNEAIVFGYLVAWFLGEVGLSLGVLIGKAGSVRDRMLTMWSFSILHMSAAEPSWPISMNGWPGWPCH